MQNAAFALANIEQENFVKISATEKSKFLDLALNSLQNRHLRDDIKSCVARVSSIHFGFLSRGFQTNVKLIF